MFSQTDQVSLLRTEAEDRAALLQVRQTRVELDLTAPGDTFTSRTTIEFDCVVPRAETFLDFKGAELGMATLDGTALDISTWNRGRLPVSLTAGAHVLVVDGVMSYSSDGEGLHRHVDPMDQQTYLYAMSFLDAGPRWFACFDQPDLKSKYQWDVRAPEHWTVVGNAPSQLVKPGWWRISPEHPLSTYYTTLVAGPYASVFDSHDGIPLALHVRASLRDALQAEAPDIFEVTKAAFDYYHRVFGVRYPFGEYHQAFVPEFNAGAMENPGCVTVRDQLIFRARATAAERAGRAGLIAHEMAHMWFGDLVTMRWWDDLWLNESFAEYVAHRCADSTRYPLWAEFGIVRKDWGAVADQSPSTHPVAGNGSADAQAALQDFDGISYAKGAAVLRQLVSALGDDVFFDGLRDYFDRHAFGNAQFADLITAWTRAGAAGLDAWAQHWLRTSGMDRVDVERFGSIARISRTVPAAAPADRSHAMTAAAYDASGALLSATPLTLGAEPVEIELAASTALLVPDAADETWAKIRFGDWPSALTTLPRLTDSPARVVIFNAIRYAVRDAELDPGSALEAICAAVESETSDAVLGSVLQFAVDDLAGRFTAAEHRMRRTSAVNAVADAVMAAAEAGSDRQLAALRIAIRSNDDPDELYGWLRFGTPEGVTLDSEITWAIIDRLCTLTPDSDLIEEALRDDPSASAHVHAAQARARLPTTAAKEAAWELLMKPSAASAYEVYATAQGFFVPTQVELTAPFVPAYFAEIPSTATFRTGWALGRVASLAYPSSATSRSTLQLAEQTLARGDVATPIRRSLIDGTDRLRRCVQSLERFGG
ncbi:MAG: Membrane alanine aminopeptidase N [uncultured Propionibacteriaceae bacterium]|uniref:Aminopeptidase N n=1 Tax=uncultured Propionibacteriaceae bacterium TaxID=257457 RepID=A0A6J4PDD8_9ACTN|nr:MAG: Membrane alanine aminopeptidase N [uncultured Propionibacteriaceae bacterium]